MQVLLEELDRRRILQKEQMPTAPKANSKALTRTNNPHEWIKQGINDRRAKTQRPMRASAGLVWCAVCLAYTGSSKARTSLPQARYSTFLVSYVRTFQVPL